MDITKQRVRERVDQCADWVKPCRGAVDERFIRILVKLYANLIQIIGVESGVR